MKAKTLLEFIKKDFKDFEQYVYFTKEMVDTALEDMDSLEQQNTALQARITELEADNKELAKDFTHSKYVDKYVQIETPKSCLSCKYFSNVFKECNALDIKWSGVIENFYCSEYEQKDK